MCLHKLTSRVFLKAPDLSKVRQPCEAAIVILVMVWWLDQKEDVFKQKSSRSG